MELSPKIYIVSKLLLMAVLDKVDILMFKVLLLMTLAVEVVVAGMAVEEHQNLAVEAVALDI